jgi:hypothetical protein
MDSGFQFRPERDKDAVSRSFGIYFKDIGKFLFFSLVMYAVPIIWGIVTGYLFGGADGREREIYLSIIRDYSQSQTLPSQSVLNDLLANQSMLSAFSIISFVLSLFFLPLTNGGIAVVAMARLRGTETGIKEALATAAGHYKKLFLLNICGILTTLGAMILLFVCFIFVTILMVFVMFVNYIIAIPILLVMVIAAILFGASLAAAMFISFPVAIYEDIGGFSAVIRSIKIVYSRLFRNAGLVLLMLLISGICTGVIAAVSNAIFGIQSLPTHIISGVVEYVAYPAGLIAAAVIYVSFKKEKEGYTKPQLETF